MRTSTTASVEAVSAAEQTEQSAVYEAGVTVVVVRLLIGVLAVETAD
ncbi:MAG: hypothetical protein ICV64_05430 [Thermoleophilia bacterium]|nr:hypothetical protein [Thermoleophilia bacterium]